MAQQHSYLGCNSEINNRKVIYPPDSILTIPLIDASNARNMFDVILPGQGKIWKILKKLNLSAFSSRFK